MKLAKITREVLFFPATSGGVAESGEVDMQGLQLSCRDPVPCAEHIPRIDSAEPGGVFV